MIKKMLPSRVMMSHDDSMEYLICKSWMQE